ncbi:MAG: ATP-binding protein, partial [Flavobacterium sp.]|nr:ATP-binding protein [Flavobacterium sp.]
FATDSVTPPISNNIIKLVESSIDKRYVEIKNLNNVKYRASYSQIIDERFKPIGILNLPYIEDDEYYERETQRFLINLAQVYVLMFIVAFVLAYFLSSYITKSIKNISDRITITRLNRRNEKIDQSAASSEIQLLVNAYNSMIDELEESAVKLAQSEREEAWREMAKQVAHEIKNPLTPMRLTVQSFQRKFDPTDPEINLKLDDYTKTLLQQIDTMSSVANAFSNFASMPAQQNDTINVVKIIRLALEIFNESYIQFESSEEEIIAKMDRTQLIRVITNLVKNAIQAIPQSMENPKVIVAVTKENHSFKITVQDNGIGISKEQQEFIFEPKFTTKSSGMGLGLGIIKKIIENYNGTISFTSQQHVGTLFTVIFPINTNE